jgi:hypothetical protein
MLAKRPAAGGIASLGWTALGLQLYLNLEKAIIDDSSVVGDDVGYLSFFTVLTTILIAACLTLVVCEPDEESFLNWPEAQTALALYILVVAIVYAAVLQGLWIPEGDRVSGGPSISRRAAHAFYTQGLASLRGSGRVAKLPTHLLDLYAYTRRYYWSLSLSRDGYEVVFLNCLWLLALFLMLGSALILIDWLLANLHTRWQSELPG